MSSGSDELCPPHFEVLKHAVAGGDRPLTVEQLGLAFELKTIGLIDIREINGAICVGATDEGKAYVKARAPQPKPAPTRPEIRALTSADVERSPGEFTLYTPYLSAPGTGATILCSDTEAVTWAVMDSRPAAHFDWPQRVFGNLPGVDVMDPHTRALRFLEEALELYQAVADTYAGLNELQQMQRIQKLASYVTRRPVGATRQEVGGVMVTLMSLCERLGLSLTECERTEAARLATVDVADADELVARPHYTPTGVRRIVGFTGRKRAGKDTAATAFSAAGYARLAFADPLKAMLAALLRIQGASDDLIAAMLEGHLKETPSELLNGRSPRHALQTLGTEWGRAHMADTFWIDVAHRRASDLSNVVVTDVRFPNEVEAIRRWGGVVYHIERPGVRGVDAHASEAQIDTLDVDGVIVNDAPSAVDFAERVDSIFAVRFSQP